MTKKLAFLGYGLRSKTMLQAFREIEADISVAAVADPRWEQIKEENAGDPLFAEARYFENADALLGAANRTAYSSARAARCIRRWRSRS